MSLTANAWTMPSETHPQERVFMAFPPLGESFGTTDDAAADARDAWVTDTRMPVGLTFAGRAYDDSALLGLAAAFEATAHRRTEPTRTPRLPPVAMRSI